MMKKLICILTLLCLLGTSCAQAESAYVPGEATSAMFIEAFERGDMVLANLHSDVTFSESAAGLYGMDSTLLSAIGETLSHTDLIVGAKQLENGLSLLLAGQYTADSGEYVVLDVTLDVTQDGVSVMSSAIPGERLTASWDTLMQLAGTSAAELEMMLGVSQLDMQTMAEELSAQTEASLDMITRIAAPYLQTISEHLAAVPQEVLENVPADGGFPAAATEITWTITSKAVGELLIALATQLEQDTTLCAILDSMLAESGEDITTVQLCQAIRQAAAEDLTDEEYPLTVFLGMDENGDFLYLNTVVEDSAGESFLIALISAPDEEKPGFSRLSLDVLTATAEKHILEGFTLSVLYSAPGAQMTDVQASMDLYAEGDMVFNGEFTLYGGASATEDGLRGEAYDWSLILVALDGEDMVSMMLSTSLQQSETAEGGEQSTFTCALDVGDGEMHIPVTCEVYTLSETGFHGPTMTTTSRLDAPTLGLSECIGSCTLSTASYTPDLSAVTDIALETASSADLEALTQRAMVNIQNTLSTLYNLLPAALTGAMQ
ncbi:MAG: hypothetical protein IKJ11_00350 [Clostridia bacterium]|nr:hypothetical protein [Clostridia bacterium]